MELFAIRTTWARYIKKLHVRRKRCTKKYMRIKSARRHCTFDLSFNLKFCKLSLTGAANLFANEFKKRGKPRAGLVHDSNIQNIPFYDISLAPNLGTL